jgi:hypothetical protein
MFHWLRNMDEAFVRECVKPSRRSRALGREEGRRRSHLALYFLFLLMWAGGLYMGRFSPAVSSMFVLVILTFGIRVLQTTTNIRMLKLAASLGEKSKRDHAVGYESQAAV